MNSAGDRMSPKALLSGEEIELLARALGEWRGPARCSGEMAVAMGFESIDDLLIRGKRISAALRDDEPLAPAD